MLLWDPLHSKMFVWGPCHNKMLLWDPLHIETLLRRPLHSKMFFWGSLRNRMLLWDPLHSKMFAWALCHNKMLLWDPLHNTLLLSDPLHTKALLWDPLHWTGRETGTKMVRNCTKSKRKCKTRFPNYRTAPQKPQEITELPLRKYSQSIHRACSTKQSPNYPSEASEAPQGITQLAFRGTRISPNYP